MGLGAHQRSDKLLVLAAVALQLQAQQGQVALVGYISAGLATARSFRFCGLQEIAVFLAALTLVRLGRQQGQLITAPAGSRRWHHSVLIEIERAADRIQQARLLQVAPELLGCRASCHAIRPQGGLQQRSWQESRQHLGCAAIQPGGCPSPQPDLGERAARRESVACHQGWPPCR